MEQTTDYDIFKFREDNRFKINNVHVELLKESISRSNRLHDYPIKVNSDMEIINGQHRVLAAKALGVPVFYQVCESYTLDDLLIDNLNKQWSPADFLNFFSINGYPEYLKLKEFMERHNLNLKCALYLSNAF